MVALTFGLVYGSENRLEEGIPIGLVVALLTELVGGLMVGLTQGRSSKRRSGQLQSLSGIIISTLKTGFPSGVSALIGRHSASPQPTHTRLQIRGQARAITEKFMGGLVAGILFGLLCAPMLGLPFGLLLGLGLLTMLVFGLEAPANTADVVSPAESLVRDRRNAFRKMLSVGLAVGLAYELAYGSGYGPRLELQPGPGLGLGLGYDNLAAMFAVAVVVGLLGVRATSAWIYWVVLARGWLPLTGRLPWRVQAFLTDAYHRGVLRQTGAVYRFRHFRLQHQLTADSATEAAANKQLNPGSVRSPQSPRYRSYGTTSPTSPLGGTAPKTETA